MTPEKRLTGHAEWPEGIRARILDTVDSTMAEAARMGGTLQAPTWIMAREQTAAHGRQGRAWVQGSGNLAATLVMQPFCTPQVASQRSFLAANALFEALAFYTDRTTLSVKWPNDVLLNGGKVAGILLESASRGPFVDWLAIGIGVNLASSPKGLGRAAFPATSLKGETGVEVSPEDFLITLAGAYATQERKLDRLGFTRIRQDWLRQAARLGETITARTAREEITGLFDTIDADGNLVLITAKGPRAIPAAEVFF